VRWNPTESFSILGNQYYGTDTLGLSDRRRIHTDDSVMVRYFQEKGGLLSRAAASLTADAGCETGDGIDCGSQYFLGFMAYNRVWFDDDGFAFTFGGGAITNPGRYLVLLPPINGATAFGGTPYFTEIRGTSSWAGIHSSRSITCPSASRRSAGSSTTARRACRTGQVPRASPHRAASRDRQARWSRGWVPDLVKIENRLTAAMMVRY
jgi:hypothetical protein